jgi:uncharacterized membrane-anchored protein
MKKKLQGPRNRRDNKLLAFGGVLFITFSVMLILNTINITAESVSFVGRVESGVLGLVVAIGFFLLGRWFLRKVNNDGDRKLAWASICITSGMSFVFLGGRVFYTVETGVWRFVVSLGVIAVGIVVIWMGLRRMPQR